MSQLQFGSYRFDPADVLKAEFADGEARVTVRTPSGQETFVFTGPGVREEFLQSARVHGEWLRAQWKREGAENWSSAAETKAPAEQVQPKFVQAGRFIINPAHIALIESLAGGKMRVHLARPDVAPIELDTGAAQAFWCALHMG